MPGMSGELDEHPASSKAVISNVSNWDSSSLVRGGGRTYTAR